MNQLLTYVALLRGINVGGNNKVEMSRLKLTFERLGLHSIKTYINSGNIIFKSDMAADVLTTLIEAEIENDFGFHVHVLLRDLEQIEMISKALPDTWLNDQRSKTDILFLWEEADSPDVIKMLAIKPGIDNVRYIAGAILWNIDRKDHGKSGMIKIMATPLYKKVTIRNANTVRKLYALMLEKEAE